MNAFFLLPAARPLVIFSVLLVLKMAAIAFATANARRKAKVVVNAEDTGVNPGSHVETQEAAEVLRAKRAHMNDLENIPAFLFIALLFTLTGGSSTGAWAYFGVYFAARLLHTITYLYEKQPWRTISFFLGQLCLIGLVVHLILKVL